MSVESSMKGSKKVELPETKEDILSIPVDKLEGYVRQAVEKMAGGNKSGKDNKILEQILGAIKGDEVTSAVDVEEIDMNDYLEEPEIFFCYMFQYTIMGDKRFGHEVKTPWNRPIEFKPLYRYKRKSSVKGGDETVSMSVARIRSKKQSDWLRSHSKFKITFFASMKGVQDVDQERASLLSQASDLVNAYTEHEMIDRARREGIQLTEDIESVKYSLINKLADDLLKRNERYKTQTVAASATWSPDRTEEVLTNVNAY